MKRFSAAVLLVLGVALIARAEEGAGGLSGYNAMNFEFGYFSMGLNGRFDEMRDGVKITLLSDDPAKKPLPLSANTVKFFWPEKGDKPSRILLEGKVVVEHPQATIHSEKADWDFEKGLLTFTGDPVMSSPQVQELRGEKVVINFKEDRVEAFHGKAKEVPLGEMNAAEGATGDAGLLRMQDILDWPGFLTKMKTEAEAEAPSPGKHLVSLLDPKAQKLITTASVETLAQDKGAVLKQFNRVLTNPKLYDAAAWNGVPLDPEATDLLSNATLSAEDRLRLNRLLLESAYPGLIAKRPKEASGQGPK
jgi:hypothetical protein